MYVPFHSIFLFHAIIKIMYTKTLLGDWEVLTVLQWPASAGRPHSFGRLKASSFVTLKVSRISLLLNIAHKQSGSLSIKSVKGMQQDPGGGDVLRRKGWHGRSLGRHVGWGCDDAMQTIHEAIATHKTMQMRTSSFLDAMTSWRRRWIEKFAKYESYL